jgi:hypothetical protein
MSAGAATFGLVVGRTPAAAVCHGALGSTSAWNGRARVGRSLGGRGFGERLETPEVFIYGTDEGIVA